MKQFGRSMIEMLGVLAIIGVLSIGGIALYRRAVNNHHANTILDDVNRFAFAIIEKGNYPLGEDLPKGDFKESGIYTLKGHQALSAGQFSILVANVPKGVCEPLVDKGIVEYKVGVVTPGGDVDDEIIYDTLHTDLCQDMNDVVFYFGDTSAACNPTNVDNPMPCTSNADCCIEEFCAFEHPLGYKNKQNGDGFCQKIDINTDTQTANITINGIQSTWVRSKTIMTWWSAQNWCQALRKRTLSRDDVGCKDVGVLETCGSDIFAKLIAGFGNVGTHWLEHTGDPLSSYFVSAFTINIGTVHMISSAYLNEPRFALCH